MTNESEIASRFAEVTGWIAEHWPWLSGSVIGLAWAMKKVYNFFQGQNRQAKALEDLTKEVREQRKKLDKMVDEEGVDIRVAPVIETVKTMQGQISQIYDHLLDPNRRRRAGEK